MYFKYIFKRTIGIVTLASVVALAIMALGQGCENAKPTAYVSSESSYSGPCSSVGIASPQTIEDVTKLINSLPQPVSIECVLASLKRPIGVFAANSTFSAQPAVGTRSPRIFVLTDKLILSVAPDGFGRDRLEMSVLVDDANSIKAELKFPIESEADIALPYSSIRTGAGTNCASCHASEHRATEIGFAEAFISEALRPDPFLEVNLENVRLENQYCNSATEPERCSILRGVFGYGAVVRRAFPAAMPTQ